MGVVAFVGIDTPGADEIFFFRRRIFFDWCDGTVFIVVGGRLRCGMEWAGTGLARSGEAEKRVAAVTIPAVRNNFAAIDFIDALAQCALSIGLLSV